jgi:hypothetical protein
MRNDNKSNSTVKKIDKTKELAFAEFLQKFPLLTAVIIPLYCSVIVGMNSVFIL